MRVQAITVGVRLEASTGRDWGLENDYSQTVTLEVRLAATRGGLVRLERLLGERGCRRYLWEGRLGATTG